MYKFLYNSEIIYDFVNSTWVKKQPWKSFKSNWQFSQGKVVPGWGAVPVMTVIGLLLLVFLVILLQIYNNPSYLRFLSGLERKLIFKHSKKLSNSSEYHVINFLNFLFLI